MIAEILVGVSASGKSTYGSKRASEGWICFDRDDLRFSLKKVKDWNTYKFNKGVEKVITDMHVAGIQAASCEGLNICIAETNLNPRTRNNLKQVCEDVGYKVKIIPLHITLEEAILRNKKRDNGLPEEVILKQWKAWEKYLEES